MDQARAEQIAIEQLSGGERLLWAGSPAPGSAALGALPATVFGIPFTGFAAFWISSTARITTREEGPWALFPLFGVPFLLIGLGLLLAPLWAYLAARNTVYAVTERRALIISGSRSRRVRSFTGAEVGNITRVERADGWGTVTFAAGTPVGSKGFERYSRASFVGIPEVRRVEQLIRDHLLLQQAA
jgi:hypothetical protein